MLNLIRSATDFVLTSDDANAENAILGDAIEAAAPHMLESFNDTEVSDDGLLRVHFSQPDWESLLEVIDWVASTGDVDPEQTEAMAAQVEEALR